MSDTVPGPEANRLQARERVGSDDLAITQAVLARILGVRRVWITQNAQKLQEAGLVRCARGRLTVLDAGRLEAHACVCYRQVTQAYRRLLDPAWPDG